jgi:hypothetical protein
MFGRSATFQFKSDKLNEIETRIPGVRDRLKSLGGLIDCYIAWDKNGAGVTMVVYDTQASADAALPTVQSIWAELADYLEGPPTLTSYPNMHRLSG